MDGFSVWHWTLGLLFVGLWIFLIVRSRRRVMAFPAAATNATQPQGIGGWLMLFALGQLLAILTTAKTIAEASLSIGELQGAELVAVYVELGLCVLVLVFFVVATVAFFRTLRAFPALWKIQSVITILFPFADYAVLKAITGEPLDRSFISDVAISEIGMAIVFALWWWYLNVSVRVRSTFVN